MSKNYYSKTLLLIIASFTLIASLFVAVFGLFSMIMAMEARENGIMDGCIFNRQAAICPMTFIEHISRWQSMFAVIPQKNTPLIQLLASVSILVFTVLALGWNWSFLPFSYFSERFKFYLKHNLHLLLFDRQKQLFSQGILNPKIY